MKTTIHINDTTTINRKVNNGIVHYNKTKYQVYESHGKYKIDVDRPILTAIDQFPEQTILDKAQEILQLRFKRTPNLFMESPQAFKDLLKARMSGLKNERFDLIMLTNRHQLIEIRPLFFGQHDSASIYPRVVVQTCLEVNAAAVAFVCFAHNHPSNNPSPSQSDIAITKKLQKALNLVEIRTLDHFIVSDSEVVSLAEKGLM